MTEYSSEEIDELLDLVQYKQYQIRGDAIVPRASEHAPDSFELSKIRDFYLSAPKIVRQLLEEIKALQKRVPELTVGYNEFISYMLEQKDWMVECEKKDEMIIKLTDENNRLRNAKCK